ncbi:hypothetical protein V6C42_08160 [Pseudoclostridium thermosuccinogenes]|uniref:hypothetical protein n=1 Tax=Clostridium thermosuccinogenes TaxID=84032 RepID=UPI002FD8F707
MIMDEKKWCVPAPNTQGHSTMIMDVKKWCVPAPNTQGHSTMILDARRGVSLYLSSRDILR